MRAWRRRRASAAAGIGPAVGARRVRGATKEEQSETIGTSAIFISLGVVLLVGAVVIDSRHDLV